MLMVLTELSYIVAESEKIKGGKVQAKVSFRRGGK